MSISSITRKAGPYTGNGVTTVFPFAFKVFSAGDLVVTRTDLSAIETTLAIITDYTVTLNTNQDTNPGGSVTTLATPANGFLITLTSGAPVLQPTVLTNLGGFYPTVLNDSLDRLTIFCQQLAEQVSRSYKVAVSSGLAGGTDITSALTSAVNAATSSALAAAASAASALGYSNAASGSATAASGSATAAAASAASALGYGPFRNRIINGGMTVDQRSAGGAVSPTASQYVLDRFNFATTQASKLTFSQVADAPPGLKYSEKITVLSQYTPLPADVFMFEQIVEGSNIVDFQFGTAGAVTITLSNYIKGSVAGNYGVSIRNGAANRSYVGTVAVTNSWNRVQLTIPGDQSGTWATDITAGLQWSLDLGSGGNFNTPGVNAWQTGNYLNTASSLRFVSQTGGSTLNITGVQVEAASSASTFEVKPPQVELAACQRYYWRSNWGTTFALNFNSYVAGAFFSNYVQFPVTMRTVPTAGGNATGMILSNCNAPTWASLTQDGGRLLIQSTAIAANCAIGVVAGNYVDASAEL